MSEAADRRLELGRFLRSRRERITPAEAGLPAGPHRRAVGLRREEVAVLAGLSPTWYTYLEQGRDIHPSAAVLDSLARVLRLTADERRYVHVLAYGTPPAGPLAGDLPARAIVTQLVGAGEHSAFPVYGVDLYCDMIAWNRATAGYYTDFGQLPAERRNMLRWLLSDPQARERLADWTTDARDIVARWRAATAAYHTDPRLQTLVAEFRRLSPEFSRWWDDHDVQDHRTRTRRFHRTDGVDEALRLIVVRAPEFEPCVVVFHVPVPEL